ncbi:hypothetical protein LAU42_02245 [Macrococcus armenti]|uniref:hypothetical protein n=1 Tax=Macrococcus armenti TaxID=2875764 RepID=UPI001CC9D401|nr:hypothetical protein [Macrococcus armenti]UBH22779.1 hypothetical protein LAU42_02245 [Macrococcus armenti]
MKQILTGLFISTLLLTACGQQQEENEEKSSIQSKSEEKSSTTNKEKSEQKKDQLADTKSTASQAEPSSPEEKEKGNEEINIKLDEKTKIALAFMHPEAEKFIVSGKEVLTGKYTKMVPPEPQVRKFYKLVLTPHYENIIPQGAKVYIVHPNKANAISFIAFTDNETVIGGTQSGYYDLNNSNNGFIRYNTESFFNEKKHLRSLKELADMVEIGEKPSYEETEREEKMTNQTVRERIYNEIIAMEGTTQLDPKYIWDDIKLDEKNNSFYVNYRNKDLEVLGTYKYVDGKLVKELIK